MLYGTTQLGGGSCNCGTVFKTDTLGNESLLFSFDGPDGYVPVAGLIFAKGLLYGTTTGNSVSGNGIVFRITLSGEERVLYSFSGGSDGSQPEASLQYAGGVFYGTTSGGGTTGNGTVFAVSTSGKESVLHSFEGAPQDGATPVAGLLAVEGIFYGTTAYGGSDSSCNYNRAPWVRYLI